MTKGFFITGTDTDVGKTWSAIALMEMFKNQGLVVAGMKPVAAGCEWQDGGLRNFDALLLRQHASVKFEYELINPYAFEPAVSPHIACGKVDVKIDAILAAFSVLQQQVDVLLVEGAGGWYSPLGHEIANADLAVALHLPVVLVVGIRLGCINHALLTWHAIRQASLTCAGWIAVEIDPEMSGFRESLELLCRAINAPLIGVLPHLKSVDFDFLAGRLHMEI